MNKEQLKQDIREYVNQFPNATVSEVTKTFRRKGYKISPQFVGAVRRHYLNNTAANNVSDVSSFTDKVSEKKTNVMSMAVLDSVRNHVIARTGDAKKELREWMDLAACVGGMEVLFNLVSAMEQ